MRGVAQYRHRRAQCRVHTLGWCSLMHARQSEQAACKEWTWVVVGGGGSGRKQNKSSTFPHNAHPPRWERRESARGSQPAPFLTSAAAVEGASRNSNTRFRHSCRLEMAGNSKADAPSSISMADCCR